LQPNAQYAALAFLRGDLYFDLSGYMGQLTVPTAIVWGEEAQFTRADLGQRLASLNPKTVKLFVRLTEAGVLPHLEHPALISGLLQAFLAEMNADPDWPRAASSNPPPPES
jgi:pimeloyl-ACP methyl ester carboxylesterase